MNIKLIKIAVVFLLCHKIVAQGVYNNGANIIFAGNAHLYIDNVTNGNYLTVGAGSITASATSSITLLANWTNNSSNKGFATPDGGLVTLAGNAQSIGGSAATAFNNLTLAGNGVKTLAVNQTTVGGQAAFAGVLSVGSSTMDLNGNTLNVTNSATGAITRSSGYIISETNSGSNPSIIKWYHRTVGGSKVYPFGVAGSYIPFTFNITAPMSGASSYVEVSTRTSPSNNQPWASGVTHMYSPNVPYTDGSIPVVIDRWWQVNNSDPVTANATFSYRGSENTLAAPYSTGLIGAQYWAGGWLPDNANIGSAVAVSSGVGSVTASGLSTFGPWVLTSLLSPLPIELVSFNATCAGNAINLEWCTASESDNDYFTVEQSANGIDFMDVSKVYGNGTTDIKHCYQIKTNSLSSDINYFRLRQTDKNKRSKTSDIISLASCDKANGNIVIASNGTHQIGVIVNSLNDQHLQLKLYNALGQLIDERPIEALKGYNAIPVNLDHLANALYYVSVYRSNEKLITKKIVVSDIGQ